MRCTAIIYTLQCMRAGILAPRTRIAWLSPIAHGKDDACDAIAEPSGWLRVVSCREKRPYQFTTWLTCVGNMVYIRKL